MKLSKKEIAFIAKDFPYKSDISLFANVQERPSGTEEKSLVEKGVYQGGKLSQSAFGMLEVVALAKKCTRLFLKDSFFFIEKYTYIMGNKIVLVENDGGEMVFSSPKDLTKTMEQVAEFTGKSMLKNSGIEILLTSDEILLFLALVDIYRKNSLLNYVGQGNPKRGIQLGEIIKQINEPSPNSLVQLFKQNYNYPIPSTENAKAILKKLTRKECVTLTDGYELSGDYGVFAQNFLIPETIIITEVFNLTDQGEAIAAGGLYVCAGLRDIVSFIIGSDGIEVSAVSGSQLLQGVENFLNCPEIY